MTDSSRPPERLSDGHVALRRFRTADAESLHEAVAASADHLRPWMPWVSDGVPTVDEYRVLIDDWCDAWSDREIFAFRICSTDDPHETLGACGLHARIEPGALELGYWVRASRTREGIATTAGRLATEAGLDLDDIDCIEIHHDAANTASQRVPEALGFELIHQREREIASPGETGRELIWRTRQDRREPGPTRAATSAG